MANSSTVVEGISELNYAKSKGWVGKNVIEDTPFEHSKRDDQRPQMPTIEEAQRIIAHTKRTWDGWLAFLYVLVFCACGRRKSPRWHGAISMNLRARHRFRSRNMSQRM
jgi:hypothetical protein